MRFIIEVDPGYFGCDKYNVWLYPETWNEFPSLLLKTDDKQKFLTFMQNTFNEKIND